MEPTRIYIAPFHAMVGDVRRSPCGSMVATFGRAVKRQDWPFDGGDDPSFYAVREFGGQLSWGVCRQDVRNRLREDDIVVFFSFRRFEDTGDSEYRLCALATVERIVRQTDLWDEKGLRKYTKYFNLLVRPSRSARGAWEHFERSLHGLQLHDDWLWRIAEHNGLRKKAFRKLEKTDLLEPDAEINGQAVEVACNYVLFSSDHTKTHILSYPPIIAEHSKGDACEAWNVDGFSQSVRRATLGVAAEANGRKRFLRIKNSQRAHRHITFKLASHKAASWRAEFLKLVKGR